MRFLAIGFLLVGCTFALPQYGQQSGGNRRPSSSSSSNHRPPIRGQHNLPAGCRIEYITESQTVEVESVTQDCHTRNERICETKQRRKCSPYTDKECHNEYVNHCDTKYRKKCQERYREIDEYVTVDDCKDKYVRSCEKHWVEYGPGDKRWEEDQSRCENLPNTECKTKQQLRKKKVPYQDCKNEPWQDCQKRKEQKCQNVVKQNCNNESWQDCRNEPLTECKDKHTKKPQTIRKQKPIRVCEDGNGGYIRTRLNEDGEEDDVEEDAVEIFDPRNEDDFIKTDDVAPRGDNSDGIVFGN